MSDIPPSIGTARFSFPGRIASRTFIIPIIVVLIISVSSVAALMLVVSQDTGKNTTPSGICQSTSTVVVNGTSYSCLNITSQVEFSSPGYSLLEKPVTFMDVRFDTLCPQGIGNCGDQSLVVNQNSNATMIRLAVISFNLTFADQSVHNVFGLLPLRQGSPIYVLSNHVSPKAGFLLEYTPGASPVNVRVILLVEGTH